jgi:hypothetical protein
MPVRQALQHREQIACNECANDGLPHTQHISVRSHLPTQSWDANMPHWWEGSMARTIQLYSHCIHKYRKTAAKSRLTLKIWTTDGLPAYATTKFEFCVQYKPSYFDDHGGAQSKCMMLTFTAHAA